MTTNATKSYNVTSPAVELNESEYDSNSYCEMLLFQNIDVDRSLLRFDTGSYLASAKNLSFSATKLKVLISDFYEKDVRLM